MFKDVRFSVFTLLDREEPLEEAIFFLLFGALVDCVLSGLLLFRFLNFRLIFFHFGCLVFLDRCHELILLAGKDFAAGGDHIDEVLGEIEHVIRAALQLLAVVEELFEVVQRDLLDLLRISTALVGQEQVFKTVIFAVGSLLDQ